MLTARRNITRSLLKRSFSSSSYMFDKGKITLDKLKEKVTEENSIDQVLVAFPD